MYPAKVGHLSSTKHWFFKQNGGNRPTDGLLAWGVGREEEKVAVWRVGGGEESTDELIAYEHHPGR